LPDVEANVATPSPCATTCTAPPSSVATTTEVAGRPVLSAMPSSRVKTSADPPAIQRGP